MAQDGVPKSEAVRRSALFLRRQRHLSKAGKAIGPIVVGLAVLYAVVQEGDALTKLFAVRPGILATTVALLAIGSLASGCVWIVLLDQSKTINADLFSVFLNGQLAKNIPGGFWQPIVQITQATRAGVSAGDGAATLIQQMYLIVAAGMMLGALILFDGRGHLLEFVGASLFAVAILMLLVAIRGGRRTSTRLSIVHGFLPQHIATRIPSFRPRFSAKGFTWALVAIGSNSAAFALTTGLREPVLIAAVIGWYSFAWAVGFLVIFVPNGAGVRESILVVGLLPLFDVGQIIAFSLQLRIVQIVSDVLLASSWLASSKLFGVRQRVARGGLSGDWPVCSDPTSSDGKQ